MGPAWAVKVEAAPGRCQAYGCCRFARARGMCDRHYRAARQGRLDRIATRDAANRSQRMREMWARIHAGREDR